MTTQTIETQKMTENENTTKAHMFPQLDDMLLPFIDGLDTIKVLSLPGKSWAYEQHLADMFKDRKLSFVGLERDEASHGIMTAKAEVLSGINPNISFTPANSSPEDTTHFLEENRGEFDVVYFDYLTLWGPDIAKDIRLLALKGTATKALMITLPLVRPFDNIEDMMNHVRYGNKTIIEMVRTTTRAGNKTVYGDFVHQAGPGKIIEEIFEEYGTRGKMAGSFIIDRCRRSMPESIEPEITFLFDMRDEE
jgi:hypothetical protein